MTDLRIGPALIVPVTAEPFTGYVEVTGGEITHLGPSPTDTPAAETVAAPGRIVIPSFVNTHCHTSQQLGRGLGDDVGLLTWLHERIWPYELALDESDSELSALVCAIYMGKRIGYPKTMMAPHNLVLSIIGAADPPRHSAADHEDRRCDDLRSAEHRHDERHQLRRPPARDCARKDLAKDQQDERE